jgi:uncharacterized OB-fold protein
MPARDSLNGVCRHCGHHLEFPPEAAGQVADCPHCGQPTTLSPGHPPAARSSSYKLLILIGLALVAGLLATDIFLFVSKQSPPAVAAEKPAPILVLLTNPPAAITSAPVVAPVVLPVRHLEELKTNDFAISAVKLEKTPGSSLVYVTGKVRNLRGQPRYGIKLMFDLSDAKHEPVGQTTDYQSMISSNAEWHFRAMVFESKAVAAHFRSVQEDQ